MTTPGEILKEHSPLESDNLKNIQQGNDGEENSHMSVSSRLVGQPLAACAGLFGALAATCAKLAMAAESSQELCNAVSLFLLGQREEYLCTSILLYVRLGFFGLVFLLNALMWTVFVRSLQLCASSVEATVVSTGSNIFCTAVIGWLLFGETLTLVWWCGATLIIIGMLFLHKGAAKTEAGDISRKKID